MTSEGGSPRLCKLEKERMEIMKKLVVFVFMVVCFSMMQAQAAEPDVAGWYWVKVETVGVTGTGSLIITMSNDTDHTEYQLSDAYSYFSTPKRSAAMAVDSTVGKSITAVALTGVATGQSLLVYLTPTASGYWNIVHMTVSK
ncbi:MAG: hypothetical protein H8E68_00745 [Kiritimatiellaeota bacterium]|nr:hypothetical protein [Kiritimatiellota bacterium]